MGCFLVVAVLLLRLLVAESRGTETNYTQKYTRFFFYFEGVLFWRAASRLRAVV